MAISIAKIKLVYYFICEIGRNDITEKYKYSEISRALAACPLFKGLKKNELDDLTELCDLRRIEKGEFLFSEGDQARALFVVARGHMRVYKLAASGREQILVTPEPATSFGEAALFADQRYPAYCVAIDDSEIVVIGKASFFRFIESRPQIALNMIAQMAERLRRFARKIEQLSLMGVVPRLAEYIAQKSGGRDEISLDISKSDLASLLGTVPETLSRAFAKLKSGGLIEEKDSKVQIRNHRALEEIAASHE